MTAFHSEQSKPGVAMYRPFADIMNHAFERLFEVEVEGLPEFENHIAFTLCDARVESNRSMLGSEFKPDVVVMSFQDPCGSYAPDETNPPILSEYITKIKGRVPPKPTFWKTVLSAVELKLGLRTGAWPEVERFAHQKKKPVIYVPVRDGWEPLTCARCDTQTVTSTFFSGLLCTGLAEFHASRRPERQMRKLGETPAPFGGPVVEGRGDDDPAWSLKLLIRYLEVLNARCGFESEVKIDLFAAIIYIVVSRVVLITVYVNLVYFIPDPGPRVRGKNCVSLVAPSTRNSRAGFDRYCHIKRPISSFF